MSSLESAYHGRKVLVTGHTGFKGAWLSRWLELLGAEVSGYSLPAPDTPNLHSILSPGFPQTIADIRDADSFARHLARERPEIVFHLAAQPLVRESYARPLETFESNIRGLWTILSEMSRVVGIRAIVVVTTDKCYLNTDEGTAFAEDHPLGGFDPYSASKACAEILCESWRQSFWNRPGSPRMATARSGNVIGGGDWGVDRLLPDAIRAIESDQILSIRNPDSTRPWQHVLESLHGYLLLGARLLETPSAEGPWNFGPDPSDCLPVSRILDLFQLAWPGLRWKTESGDHPHEAKQLVLDTTKSRNELGWSPSLDPRERILLTARWHAEWSRSHRCICDEQIASFQANLANRMAA